MKMTATLNKAEIEAANAAEATPAPTPEPVATAIDDDLFDDFDEPAPAVKTVTQEDVRGALLAFKNALAAKLIEKGTEAKEANTKAMGKAKSLLNEVAGTEVLGAVTADKFAAVIEFAQAQIAKVATK